MLEAAHGSEAIELLASDRKIDALLTDVVLPGGMNGKEIAERAKELRPAIAIIFMSGYTENAIVHGGRLDAGVRLLEKPFRGQELARMIYQALN